MDLEGITWLDWVMAALTVTGFAATFYGLWSAWNQAQKATTAAEAAKTAVLATRGRLITVELINEFSTVRQAAAHVERATEDDNVEVAKFALVQLADAMRKSATLANDAGSPAVPRSVIDLLDSTSKAASAAKAELAKKTSPKVRTHTGGLLPQLTELSHALLEFETAQKYALTEEH